MSFPPIDPAGFNPPGCNPPAFAVPEDLHTLPVLSQPDTDPSITLDVDDSAAIDRVRAILAADFTETRAQWLHLMASLIADARNGVRSSILTSSIRKFSDLSPFETSTLRHLKLALESFDTFFDDVQDNAEDWVTCMNCVTSFQLPASKDEWSVNLTECGHQVEMARTLTINQATEEAHVHIQDWVNGERISAQDAAITNLTSSDQPPDISTLISDPRLIGWSRRLLEAMKLHFTETLVTEASHVLPTHLSDRLDAKRQAKLDEARSAARAEAKRLYHAELQNLQSAAMREAAEDFEIWKVDTLIPEWQAKEAAAKAEKLLELDAFKHRIAIETEDHKENARIVVAKSIVHSKSDQRSRRQECRANPLRASRSVSHARSPSPSPSRKLDKTPMKADFQVSSQTSSAPLCAPVSNHAWGRAGPSVAQEGSGLVPSYTTGPLSGPGIMQVPVGTLGDADSGLPSTPTSCLPEALPTAAPPVSSSNAPDVMMAPAAPSGDACPSSARPVPGPEITSPDSGLLPTTSLVDRYQSVTPSPASPPTIETAEDWMMRLLGSTITAALVPLKSSIEDISARLHTVEDTQNWVPSDGDGYLEDFDPTTHGYDVPLMHPDRTRGEERADDYHTLSTPSRADAEDAEMEDVRKRFESHDDNEDPHPFFESVVLHARNQPRNEMDPAHLATLADMVALDWDDFCSSMFLDRLAIPPISVVGDTFVTHTRMYLIKLQSEDDLHRALRADDWGRPASLSGPSFTGPFLTAAKDNATVPTPSPAARPSTEPPTRLSEPISISSDRTKISGFTESSPPPRTRPVGSALDLDTPPPGDGSGWKVMGGKRSHSFASIAALRPNASTSPIALPPSAAATVHGFLMKPQLDSLSREQVISAYNARFTPKLGLCIPKERAVAMFLDKASCPVPTPPPAPRPISKTKFTLVYDTCAGDLSAPSGRRGDAASYVRTI